MHITQTDLAIQRQPFARPFAFKGSAFHEKWNMVARLQDADGRHGVGLGGLAVLWSDAAVFAAHSETGGNLLQAALLEFALQRARGQACADPVALFDAVAAEVFDYGKAVTRNPDLRRTFALVALVALDNAAWLLHAKQRGLESFDALIPPDCRAHLAQRQRHVAAVPAVGYNMPPEELRALLDHGAYILKIKIGHPGTQAEMLEKDQAWLSRIHQLAAAYETPMTDSGQILYYLDANGRYDAKDSMARLLDHARAAGFLDRILLIEEPFADPGRLDVHGLPARFAGDESIETVADVQTRLDQGYGAMAIKPAGKTLSLAFRMVAATARAGIPCFVADNACVPALVEWNKNVAARLPAFPGIKGGLMETNGPENYGDAWDPMLAAYPYPGAAWLRPQNGAFVLDEAYFAHSGGIFAEPTAYTNLLRQQT